MGRIRKRRKIGKPKVHERAICEGLANALRRYAVPGVIWFHVPNGEARDVVTGARLKRMGVRRGVADYVVIVPGDPPVTHMLEIKTESGRQSADQKAFEADCAAIGVPYHVANGLEDALRILSEIGAVRLLVV